MGRLVTAPGSRLAIVANLPFGRVTTGTAVTMPARLSNVGANPLTLSRHHSDRWEVDFRLQRRDLADDIAAGR